MHVERQLTLALGLLLLRGEDLIPLSVDTLREQLLDALGGEDVLQNRLRLLDETAAEGAQTKLDDGAVVENLCRDVGRVDRLLQVRHEQHVARGVEVIVEGVVVDMAEHGTSTEEGVAGLV